MVFFLRFLFFIFIFLLLGIEIDRKKETTQKVNLAQFDKLPSLYKIEKRSPFQTALEERLKFEIVFQNITAGHATLLTRSPENPKNKGSVYFQIDAETADWVKRVYTLKMSMFAYADPVDYTTIKFIEEKYENKNYYYLSQYFSKEKKSLFFSYKKNSDWYIERSFSKALRGVSVPAAFYFARTTDLEIGKSYFTVSSFRDQIFPIGVEIVGREEVKTSYGNKKTVVIRPLMTFSGLMSEQRDMLIYLSDDERRIPLLMVAKTGWGDFKAYLIEGF